MQYRYFFVQLKRVGVCTECSEVEDFSEDNRFTIEKGKLHVCVNY